MKAKQQQPSASSSSSRAFSMFSFLKAFSSFFKPPENNKEPHKPEEKPKTEVEQITEEVNEYLENPSKGVASKAEGGDLLTRTEALKKETKNR